MSGTLSKERFLEWSRERLLVAVKDYANVPPAIEFEAAFDKLAEVLRDTDTKPVIWQLIFRGTGEGLKRVYGKTNSW